MGIPDVHFMKLKDEDCGTVNGYWHSESKQICFKLLQISYDHSPQPHGTSEKDWYINFSSILEKNFRKN